MKAGAVMEPPEKRQRDCELLARYALTGDTEAFGEIVSRYSGIVHATCLRILGEPHAADDAVQAAFLVLARKARRLPPGTVLGGWLFRTAEWVARNSRKMAERRRRHEKEAAAMKARTRSAGYELWARVEPHLDTALAALPAGQRDAIVLRHLRGLSESEVCRELGAPRTTISKRLARGLEALRSALAGRGVRVSSAALAVMLTERAAAPAGAALVAALKGMATGNAASGQAVWLAEGAMRTMAWAKVNLAASVLAAVTLAAGGTGLLVRLATGQDAMAGTPAGQPAAAAPAPTPSGPQTVVLANDSYVRSLFSYRTPVFITKSGEVKVALDPGGHWGPPKDPKPLPDFQSPLPAADWVKPDFDDSDWDLQRAPAEVAPRWQGGSSSLHSATVNSIIHLRWRFLVDDPAKARDVRLSLEYVGGVVVRVNGQELKRAHLPAGELKPDTLAEKYPDDLYVLEGNKMLQHRWPGEPLSARSPYKEQIPLFERRYRKLTDLVVPGKLLRRGTNVLTLEIRRAPTNEAAIAAERTKEGAMSTKPGVWAFAGLRNITLTAASGSGVGANVGRPKGVQVWNVTPFQTVTSYDYGDPAEPIRPVAIAAARNGVFSGRLMVSSDQALKGLKVTVSDLAQPQGGAKIPSAAVRVRCAAPGVAIPYSRWAPPDRYDALLDAIPEEIPPVKAPPPRENYLCEKISRPGVTSGALAPLWFTVRVPRDAQSGSYQGTVTVAADGLKPTVVPLHLAVSEWTAPDPKDFRMQHFAYLSDDAVAKHYGVPLWSDKHLELMSKSLALMAEVNSRQVIMNLAINFYGGNKGGADSSNEESIVRWIKQPDGSYKHDFSIFDKYLDMVARTIGKPSLLRVNCWGEVKKKDGKLTHNGVTCVSRLDPETGKVEPMEQPVPGTEESYAFWKPVLDEVRKKVEARGWWDVTAMGHNSYCYAPAPEVVSIYKRIWSDGSWSYTAHNGTLGMRFNAAEKGVSMPVRQADAVWTLGQLKPRGQLALLKPRPNIWCFTWRSSMRDGSPLTLLRSIPEDEIMRGHDGVSDFGADLFPVKAANGRFYCVGNGRGTGGPSCSTLAMLAPGADGAVATERFEMLREGTELSEAILFVEKALLDKKVSGDLEQRLNRHLDHRAEAYMKGWSAGRLERDVELLKLAGEVAAACAKSGSSASAPSVLRAD